MLISYSMFEYIFFDAALRDRFVLRARENGVACQASDDPLGYAVCVPEDLPEEVLEDLEQYYDLLEKEQIDLSRKRGDLKGLASFSFKLPDGQSRMLPLQTELANRLLASFTLDEIQRLFEDVARCTLGASDEHLCRILRAENRED